MSLPGEAVGAELSIEVLRERLRSPDLKTRWAALRRIAEIDAGEATREIIAAIKDGDEQTAGFAANLALKMRLRAAVPALIERLGKLDTSYGATQVRLMVQALAFMPDTRAIPVLAQLAAARHRGVRREAATALGAIGSPAAREALMDASQKLSWLAAKRVQITFARWARRDRAVRVTSA